MSLKQYEEWKVKNEERLERVSSPYRNYMHYSDFCYYLYFVRNKVMPDGEVIDNDNKQGKSKKRNNSDNNDKKI